jgi:hypothetical protein
MAVGVLTGVVIALAFAYPGRRMRSSADQIAARGPMVRCATIGGQKGAIGSCCNPQISRLAALIGFG